MELHSKAIKRLDGAVTISRRQRPLLFLYGPFVRLTQGRYRLHLRCEARNPRNPSWPVMGVEIIAQNKMHLGWRDFTADELLDGTSTLDFAVPSDLAADTGTDAPFEFRIMHFQNADLTITAVDLSETDEEEATTTASAEWRLLGRLRRYRLVLGGGGGVRVSPPRLTGLWVWWCYPQLHLPAGAYRLELPCELRSVRRTSQPVLRVEALTQHGTVVATHDFLAGELADGLGKMTFVVPEELGIESGEHIRLEFRLSHFRNSRLTLRAINLLQIPPPQVRVPVVAPRQPVVSSVVSARTRTHANVLIIGNCQAALVADAFFVNESLARQFKAKYHAMDLQPNLHEQGKRDLAECDVLLVQDTQDWSAYPLRPYVADPAAIVTFPCLRFASLWPFDAYNGLDDRHAKLHDFPNYEFTYFDGILGRLRKEIPDHRLRFLAYQSLEIERLVDCRRIHAFEERRLAAMDAKFGCTIGSYVLENFRSDRVFHTTGHPNGECLARLLSLIAAALGVKKRLGRAEPLNNLGRMQIPVHPKVARALGVTWADENTKYLYLGEYMTWETYIRRYIEYYG